MHSLCINTAVGKKQKQHLLCMSHIYTCTWSNDYTKGIKRFVIVYEPNRHNGNIYKALIHDGNKTQGMHS